MTIFDSEHGSPTPSSEHRSAQAGQGVMQLVMTSVLVIIAFTAGWFGNSYVNHNITATGDQQTVLQAWNLINQRYVNVSAINQQKMAYAAINAIVTTLGDTGHSRFETPEQFAQETKELQSAQSSGIGVLLTGGGDQPLIIEAVFPGSPASKVNVKAGDIIVAVNGTDIRGKTIDQVRPLIVGKDGTQVTLTLIRPSASATATFDVTITRGAYTFSTVDSYIIPGVNIAYIHINEFTQDADNQLRDALKQAQDKHVAGIILDLRDNPGGYLDQAQSVSSEFIAAGQGKNVLIEKTRDSQQALPVKPGGLATTTPLAILVNGDTASAAEITAGAININRPQVEVIGETTFGTGTILQTFQLNDGSALVLGTEEWLLPNGQSVYGKGYQPDQKVTLPSGVAPLQAIAAQQQNLSLAQIQQSGDTQLLAAINDLTGQK
ncbi:MAG: hypothetical protein OJF49_000880 [Ktedonobacterales bacterium]|jgi:carboxyl-terminal processing protease|nr:MAG: hypothetical protein OJF49_000880 [Ktedonobacterales bacterium]